MTKRERKLMESRSGCSTIVVAGRRHYCVAHCRPSYRLLDEPDSWSSKVTTRHMHHRCADGYLWPVRSYTRTVQDTLRRIRAA